MKVVNHICQKKGCSSPEHKDRYCQDHFNQERQKWLDHKNQSKEIRYKIAWEILKVLKPTLDLEDVCEETSRNIFLETCQRSTLLSFNETSFRGLTQRRKRFKIDIVLEWIKTFIEWKLSTNTVTIGELYTQIETQRRHIANEGKSHYNHIICSVIGDVGTYNLLTIFEFTKEEVNRLYKISPVRPISFDIEIFNLVFDRTIAKLQAVKHLFRTPAHEGLIFEVIQGKSNIQLPVPKSVKAKLEQQKTSE